VLFVLQSAERRNNLAEALLRNNPPILSLVWLTTLDEITRDPLAAIWIRPIDYRGALASTPHDITAPARSRKYRRSGERDSLVEERVQKRALLD